MARRLIPMVLRVASDNVNESAVVPRASGSPSGSTLGQPGSRQLEPNSRVFFFGGTAWSEGNWLREVNSYSSKSHSDGERCHGPN